MNMAATMNVVAEDTRQRLLETAGQIFADRGLHAATVREICKQAGVNIAAINYHFGDKERLYVEAVKFAHRCRIEEMPIPDWPEGTPATVKLRHFIGMMLHRMVFDDSPAWQKRLVLREMSEPTGACAELVRDRIRPVADRLTAILRELLPPDTSPMQAYLVGFSVVGQCFLYGINKPVVTHLMAEAGCELDVELVAEHITRFTLAALGLAKPVTDREVAS
jgi:AcrR family transcriptional regulator